MYYRIGTSRVYIGGAIHRVPARLPLADWVLPAYVQSAALYLEHDVSAEALARVTHFPDGQSMERRLPPSIWAQIRAAWPATTMPLTTQRPFVIAAVIAFASMPPTDPGVEAAVMARAQADSRRPEFLESTEEFSEALDGLPDSVWSDAFEKLFRSSAEERARNFAALYQAWIAGDVQEVSTLTAALVSQVPQIAQAIFEFRNLMWLPRILKILGSATVPTLILVGAGHLGGASGLLALLNQAGHTATRTKLGG